MTQISANGIPASETLETYASTMDFTAIEIAPVRDTLHAHNSETDISVCSPEDREGWSIYGVCRLGFSIILHDCNDEQAGPALMLIHKALRLPIRFYSDRHRQTADASPLALAEWLTEQIHDEIPGYDDAENFRDDDFDNHPLTPLRESLCAASGYAGETIIHPQETEL